MSENPRPSHSADRTYNFSPHWRERFRRDLSVAGFECLRVEHSNEWWTGKLHVSWEDIATDDYCTAEHLIQILLPVAFPFAKPQVFPCDTNPPIRNNRHQSPGSDNGALCLWPSDGTGWRPSMDVDDVLARIRQWFIHYHRDDWPAEDRPPDLHLYFPAKAERALMLIGDDWRPSSETLSGRFGVWQKDHIRAFAGAPQVGLSMPPEKHSDRILSTIGMAECRRTHVGLWFRLRREPKPQQTLEALLDDVDDAACKANGWALSQLRGLFGTKTRGPNVRAFLSLGYPDATGKEQWLFLSCNLGSAAKNTNWSHQNALRRIGIESFETADVGQSALMRRTGHIAQQIEGCRVLIFGQGAVGGTVTLLLAKAGIQHLRIVDSDTLRPGNAVRHVGNLLFVGHDKTLVAQIATKSHTPDCAIVTQETTWDPQLLEKWVREADVVIDATANISFSFLLNQLCLDARRPAIYVTAHRRAAVGRIRIVRPSKDACLTCHEGGYRETNEYPIIPLGEEGMFVESGCGVPTVEASAVDIDHIANWAARVTLWLLQNKLEENCFLLVVNDAIPEMGDQFNVPGIYWSAWKPLPNCETCRNAQE